MHPFILTLSLVAVAVKAISDANAPRTAHGHDVDPPAPTALAQRDSEQSPEFFTVRLSVVHTAAVTTVHKEGAGSPEPVGGHAGPGTLSNGAVATFVVPRDYHGNIAVNNAQFPADTGDESLIEFSFMNQSIYTPDIDVSYV
ncbi:hypothetical protein IF1G_11241 [Cordyceps javanica]|uniref:Uncharacterized protein n=1 Tax=Cordyceps javanica TaxID=43265 RepID=A0A545VIP8_9HYPO|nr:hypothetical protein IF1G_11241 [Cordyceps javanica]TQW01526.1 hypothetical protein IF2G_10957 [Cordyceps javanica]